MRAYLIRSSCLILLLSALGNTSIVGAHYLWITVDEPSGKPGIANLYFEESPNPGDGFYLDPFVKSGQTWIRTVEELKPKKITLQEKKDQDKRWMTGEIDSSVPSSLDSYGKFGVYAYGKTNVLLHYYARHLNVETHEDLHELARAKQMKLDIVPHDHADELELRVLWEGKPAAQRTVRVRGPKGFKQNLKTDEKGYIEIPIQNAGDYTFHTFIELDESGRDGEKDYSLIRHHATMTISLPLKK